MSCLQNIYQNYGIKTMKYLLNRKIFLPLSIEIKLLKFEYTGVVLPNRWIPEYWWMTWENYKKGYEKEARNVLFLSIIHYCNFLFIKAKTTQWVNIRMRRNVLPIITYQLVISKTYHVSIMIGINIHKDTNYRHLWKYWIATHYF